MKDVNLLSQPEAAPQQPIIQQINPRTIPAGTIGQRQLKSGYTMVRLGLASERPKTSNETTLFFSTDTFIMSYWTGTAWKSSAAFT